MEQDQMHCTAERALIARLSVDHSAAVEACAPLLHRAIDLDWARICLLAVQHRVEGLLMDTLDAVGCTDRTPPSVVSTLRRRAQLAEARTAAILAKAEEVHRRSPGCFDDLVLYKGITLAGRYRSAAHRMVSDLDAVVAEGDFERIRRALLASGFAERQGYRGSSFYAEPASSQIGVDHVMFDLHLEPLPRFRQEHLKGAFWRLPHRSTEVFHLVPDVLEARRYGAAESVLLSLVYLAEHAASWIHACFEDDIRLVKMLDVELLCAQESVSGADVRGLAEEGRVLGATLLGAALLVAVRGAMPASLAPLLGDIGDPAGLTDLLDLVALPDGTLARWPMSVDERVFRTDRSGLALGMAPGGRQSRRDWHDPHGLLLTDREQVSAIMELAEGRCAGRAGSQ
ncbi:nucleotidyltransferase family protein [Streptomyces sp. NPDC002520]